MNKICITDRKNVECSPRICADRPSKSIYRGDIFLVDFKKNEGSEQSGIRPALILQNDVGNCFSPTTIVCPLSSRNKFYDTTHVKLSPEDCGILVESNVLCEQIRVIDKSRLIKRVGRIISSEKLADIDRKTKILLGWGAQK